jgi:arylsulfatase
MATCVAASGASYPSEFNGKEIKRMEGESLLEVFGSPDSSRQAPIFWEHEGNRAMRAGDWKLVSEYPSSWELYNMTDDRTELNDLAGGERERLSRMVGEYEAWAERCEVDTELVRSSSVALAFPGPSNHAPRYTA